MTQFAAFDLATTSACCYGRPNAPPTFKSWIRWCLVGDPDLGFVDKDYRL